jgi:glucose/arabinose dehydrogenase
MKADSFSVLFYTLGWAPSSAVGRNAQTGVRLVPGAVPERSLIGIPYATGFTNIIGLAFTPDGNLYVLEIAANSLISGWPTGALIRVDRKGTQTTVLADPLSSPGGITVGPDGALYVTNHSTSPGVGEVLRIKPSHRASN